VRVTSAGRTGLHEAFGLDLTQVLAEFGLVLPPDVEIRIEDSNQKCRIPLR